MPTLAGINGASLVPDLQPAIARYDRGQERERLLEAEAGKKAAIEKQIGALTDPNAPKDARRAALLRLNSIDAKVGGAALRVIESGDEAAKEQLKATSERAAREAVLVGKQPTFAAKRQAINSLAQDAAARGEDVTRFVDLMNKDEAQLDLAIQKAQVMGADLKSILGERFEEVTDEAGNVIGQRSTQTGKVVADPRAESASTPTTDIGKARADLKKGFITQDEFNTIKSTPKKFQSKVGQLIGDRQAAIAVFGEKSPQVQALDAVINSEKNGEPAKLSDVAGARKEFTKLSGSFITLRDAVSKLRKGAENPSAAGDLAMIFNFMKIQDPGSTVREGEFANAANSAGTSERIKGLYNKVITGQRLTEDQRADFLRVSNEGFNEQLKMQKALEQSFRSLAESQNMKPEDVVLDFVGDLREQTQTTDLPAEGATATNPQTGEKIIFKGGKWQTQ